MKILVRFMSLIIIGLLISISLIYLVNINIMKNEMDNATKLSIEACQNIVKSKILDNYLDLEDSSYPIYNDESYKEYFISAFNGLVTNKDIYDIDVRTDYSKGLICVKIHNKYSGFVRDIKTINIIEVCE